MKATKTISIEVDVYDLLKSRKLSQSESCSQVIRRELKGGRRGVLASNLLAPRRTSGRPFGMDRGATRRGRSRASSGLKCAILAARRRTEVRGPDAD
jgi:hypothetical protein